jgi:hypothetical protein
MTAVNSFRISPFAEACMPDSKLAALHARRPVKTHQKTRNGVPLLPVNPDMPRVTSELVHQLREEPL